MLRGITVGVYVPGNSPLHLMDSRIKLLLLVVFIILLFVKVNTVSYILAALFLLSCLAVSRIPLKAFFWGVKPFFILAVLTVLLHLFLAEGTTLFAFGSLTASKEGFLSGSITASRLLLLISASIMLTATTSPIKLGRALEKISQPFSRLGLPISQLSMMFSIALRFLPTLLIETDRIIKAQLSRGSKLHEGSITDKTYALTAAAVPLFVNSFRRAEELAVAMEARGYSGGERTKMISMKIRGLDLAALFIFGLYVLVFFAV